MIGLHVLPVQCAQQLGAETANMVFDDPRLCRRNIHNMAREWRGRFGGMECLLDVAQQFVDVLASDAQSPPLRIVERTSLSWSYDLWSAFGHDSSKFSSASRSHLPS
jgi:hypothetical protein